MEIPIHIGIHNKIALGVFHVANRQMDIPIVAIMCYGLNGDRVEQHRMSVTAGRYAFLNRINFVRMDYCDQGVSQGSFINVTISSKINDIQHLLKEVKSYFGSQSINIYLIGFSDGSRVAANVGALDSDIKGLIFWNPIIKLPNFNEESSNPNQVNEKLHLDNQTKKAYKSILGVKLNTTAIREMKNDNTYHLLKYYNSPVLYIFGSMDRFTLSLQQYINDSEIYQKDKDCIHTVKGAHHIFSSSYFEKEVIETTFEWIKNKS